MLDDIEYRDKIVSWLKENGYYAVLHDGHWSRYFHIRTLDETCKGLVSEIYGAFLESYDCEFSGKGKQVVDYCFHLDAKPSWEFFYKRVVLKEDVPEDRHFAKYVEKRFPTKSITLVQSTLS